MKPLESAITGVSLTELGAKALLGTERVGGSTGDPAALLRQAAIHGLRSRAGFVPGAHVQAISTCPDDDRPVVNAECSATLRRILREKIVSLLEEWSTLARARGQRAPDSALPQMLDIWVSQSSISMDVWQAMGNRAVWLQSLNAAWQKRVGITDLPVDIDASWTNGTLAERIGLLSTLRMREPRTTERLLRMTWSQDSADHRRKFVAQLSVNLSMTDEPLLEWALGDRSTQVRDEAAKLLAYLPTSRYAARMVERAAAMFTVEKVKTGLLRRTSEKITIEPPKAWDQLWARDGLVDSAPGTKGKRAHWMYEILSRTPPGALAKMLGLSPQQLIDAAVESDYADDVLNGFSVAAAASRSDSWCELLVRLLMTRKLKPGDNIIEL